MCRMLLAHGRFDADRVLAAARQMSMGVTADDTAPLRCHSVGWGAAFRVAGQPSLGVHRSLLSLENGWDELKLPASLDLLVVHARHATLTKNLGLIFTHPITRPESRWLMFHNGYLPGVHRQLGLAESSFDTLEFFDFVVTRSAGQVEPSDIQRKFEQLGPNSTCANFFLVSPERAIVGCWFPAHSPHARYYTLWALRQPAAQFIASEPIPSLGPTRMWTPLVRGEIREIPLD